MEQPIDCISLSRISLLEQLIDCISLNKDQSNGTANRLYQLKRISLMEQLIDCISLKNNLNTLNVEPN
jgi:hypothetical protein